MFRFALVVLLSLAAGATPGAAQTFARPHPETASAEQPVRRVPTTGYTLALSWAPEYCHGHAARVGDGNDAECTGPAARGFVLHGLWPDGDGPNRWPQYCHPVAILTDAEIRDGVAATPSPQLLQHEWAKHGSCMAARAGDYFAEEDRLFRAVRSPDMASLAARRGLTASQVQAAFAAANPGMTPEMVRLNVNRRGWLEEVWLCLGLDKRPRACPVGQGGAATGTVVKVQGPG